MKNNKILSLEDIAKENKDRVSKLKPHDMTNYKFGAKRDEKTIFWFKTKERRVSFLKKNEGIGQKYQILDR